jgi:hypothetical protein
LSGPIGLSDLDIAVEFGAPEGETALLVWIESSGRWEAELEALVPKTVQWSGRTRKMAIEVEPRVGFLNNFICK